VPGLRVTAQAAGGGQGVGDQPGCAAGGVGGPLAQSGGGDDRRRQGRGGDREQRVQAFDVRVPISGALFGVAVGGADGVVEVDVGDLSGIAQQRRDRGQVRQERGRDRVQLPHVPEPERPQERAQR
jgi:hypothetical protein